MNGLANLGGAMTGMAGGLIGDVIGSVFHF
jgi:hypothetical protein